MAKNKSKESAASLNGEENQLFSDDVDFDEEDKVPVNYGSAEDLRKFEDALAPAIVKQLLKRDWMNASASDIYELISKLITKSADGTGVKVEGVAQELVSEWFTVEKLVGSFIAVRDGVKNGVKVSPKEFPVHLQTLMPKIRECAKNSVKTNAQRLKVSYLLESAGRMFMPGKTVEYSDFEYSMKTIVPGFIRSITNAMGSLANDVSSMKDALADYADEIQTVTDEALKPLFQRMWATFVENNK